MKKTISVLLALLLLCGTFVFAGPVAAADGAQTEYAAGDVIEYGSYPQSRVTDEALLEILPTLPGEWKHFGEYSVSVNFTFALTGNRYIDVVYQNKKYRGVVIDAYKPFCTPNGTEITAQEANGYLQGQTYWFRFEPLRWRVLDPESGLVMCDTLIDSQPFVIYMEQTYAPDFYEGEYGSSTYVGYTSTGEEFHAGWWRTVSEWLNEEFLNDAFSSVQQTNILQDRQVNDYWYVSNGTYSQDGNGYHKYDAPATQDKIFLPAWDEVSDAAAGFAADCKVADAARTLGGSDYAKAQGLQVFGEEQTARWLLRTTSRYFSARCSSLIDETGRGIAHPGKQDRSCFYGICPMMRLEEIVDDGTGNALLHVGDNFFFGAYPQSRVTDAETIALLNARLPYAQQRSLTEYTYTWNYVAEKHIDYADMIVGTQKYRAKIRYTEILTQPTGNTAADEYTDYDYRYTDGDLEKYVSYYLFEPLLWRLLDPETGLSMCEGIVESLVYQNVHIRIPDPRDPEETYWYWDAWGNEAETRYATDYTISNVRAFLNGDFYNTAFTAAQQGKLVAAELDNTSMMTLAGDTGYEQYDWESCTDKVFLLSSAQVMNPDYGFDPDPMVKDSARVLFGNDYAGYTDQRAYNNSWILRNAADMYPGRRPGSCTYYGQVGSSWWANELQPICPAICLSEIDNDISAATAECTSHVPAVEPVIPATCTQNGTGKEVCALCGAVLNENVVIPAPGHELIPHEGKAPTCGEAGWAAYETCARCDYTTYQALGATGNHAWGWVTDTGATCGAPGVKHEECSVCHAIRGENTAIDPTGAHTWGWVTDTEAACAAPGVKHEECAVCHIKRSENTPIDPTGVHVYTDAAVKEAALKTPAACAQDAVYYYSCKDCGLVEFSESHTFAAEGTALRHVSSDWIVDAQATCKLEGRRHTECTVCHTVLETDTIGKRPHTPQTVPGKEATCKETGLTDGTVCAVCGDVLAPQTVIGTKPHSYNAGTLKTPPTCTTAGKTLYTCTVCGHTKTETQPPLGHAWGGWTAAKQPTCTEAGQEIRICSNDPSHTETRPVAKTGHKDANGDGYCDYGCGTNMGAPEPGQPQSNCVCGRYHTGPFAGIIIFFHRIAYFFRNLFSR